MVWLQVDVGPLIAPGVCGFLVITIDWGALVPQVLPAVTVMLPTANEPAGTLQIICVVPCPLKMFIWIGPVGKVQVYVVA